MGRRGRGRGFASWAVCAWLVDWASASPVAAGHVDYLSQSRDVFAHLREIYVVSGEPFDDNDSLDAPDLGDWDATAVAAVDEPPVGQSTGRVTMSQRSALAKAGISAAGAWTSRTASERGGFAYRTNLTTTFQLNEASDYALSFNIQRPFFPAVVAFGSELTLSPLQGGSAWFTVDPYAPCDDCQDEDFSTGTRTGVLAPGRYQFVFAFRGAGLSDFTQSGTYTWDLRLTPAVTPVPLPPAAWPAAATAGLLALARLCRRTR